MAIPTAQDLLNHFVLSSHHAHALAEAVNMNVCEPETINAGNAHFKTRWATAAALANRVPMAQATAWAASTDAVQWFAATVVALHGLFSHTARNTEAAAVVSVLLDTKNDIDRCRGVQALYHLGLDCDADLAATVRFFAFYICPVVQRLLNGDTDADMPQAAFIARACLA